MKTKNILDDLFRHSDWFTDNGKPYIKVKNALQYYASSGDFDYNGKRLLYTGREGGYYNLSKIESEYYETLLENINEAKEIAKGYITKLQEEVKQTEKRAEKSILFNNILIKLSLNPGFDYIFQTYSFIDYLKVHCPYILNETNYIVHN